MSEVERISVAGLKVARVLYDFVVDEVIPDSGIEAAAIAVWQGLAGIIQEFAPLNHALLQRRDELQAKIDDWYRGRRSQRHRRGRRQGISRRDRLSRPRRTAVQDRYRKRRSGNHLVAGPQLVVPISNARYALNAANARWGSLYDALYGTDAIPKMAVQTRRATIRYAASWYRLGAALSGRNRAAGFRPHADVARYAIDGGALTARSMTARQSDFWSHRNLWLSGRPEPSDVSLLVHNGLHAEIVVDRSRPVGAEPIRPASPISSLEAAISTIQDLEDSIAAVDADDKVARLSQLARPHAWAHFSKIASRNRATR